MEVTNPDNINSSSKNISSRYSTILSFSSHHTYLALLRNERWR